MLTLSVSGALATQPRIPSPTLSEAEVEYRQYTDGGKLAARTYALLATEKICFLLIDIRIRTHPTVHQ